MRSTIRTVCATCGTVEVPLGAARLVVAAVGDSPGGVVEFTCPRCGHDGSQQVDARGESLLSAAGITIMAVAAFPEAAPAGEESDRSSTAG